MELSDYIERKEFWTLGYGNTLQIVIKITERCNLACDYCYFFFGGDESYKEHSPTMSASTIESLANFVQQGVKELSLTKVTLILHGGEPLMMKKSRFSQMCEAFTRKISGLTELNIDIQTNATLIDDEWIDIFSKYDIGVGVSIDGPEKLNDQHRIDKKGRGSHARVIQGIQKLKNAMADGRINGIGVINVVNPEYEPKAVYDHITKELGLTGCHFLLPDQSHHNTDLSTMHTYTDFLIGLLEAWLSDERGEVDIRFFNSIVNRLKRTFFEREYVEKISNYRTIILSVSSDGEIGPDDTLRTANPDFMKTGLFVHNTTLLDTINHPLIRTLASLPEEIPFACQSCDWAKACQGGEPIHNYTGIGETLRQQFQEKSIYCDSLMSFYETLTVALMRSDIPDQVLEEALGFTQRVA